MSMERDVCFEHHHPTVAGHFPGDPLIPGVVILDEVEQTLAAILGPGHIIQLPVVKFLNPLRPGETLKIHIEPFRPGQYRFTCACAERRVAEGCLIWEAA